MNIENAIRLKAAFALSDAKLSATADARFPDSANLWYLAASGTLNVEGQQPATVSLTLSETAAKADGPFGRFQPPYKGEPAFLTLGISPMQMQTLTQAFMSTRAMKLMVDAVVSLDVPPAQYAQSYGGGVEIFSVHIVVA